MHPVYSIVWPVKKTDTLWKLINFVSLGYTWSWNSNLSRHDLLPISKIHSCISIIPSVNKADIMCYLVYCVDYRYSWFHLFETYSRPRSRSTKTERDNKAFFSKAYNWQTQLVLNARYFVDRTNKNTTSTKMAESPWFDHHTIRSCCPRHHRTLPNILINNIPSRRHQESNMTPLIMNAVRSYLMKNA